jgi:hypothetical protein
MQCLYDMDPVTNADRNTELCRNQTVPEPSHEKRDLVLQTEDKKIQSLSKSDRFCMGSALSADSEPAKSRQAQVQIQNPVKSRDVQGSGSRTNSDSCQKIQIQSLVKRR